MRNSTTVLNARPYQTALAQTPAAIQNETAAPFPNKKFRRRFLWLLIDFNATATVAVVPV